MSDDSDSDSETIDYESELMDERENMEAAVKHGKLHLRIMKMVREIEKMERKVQVLLDENQEVEKLLGVIEKETEEDQDQREEVERRRRETVVKLWKVQLRVMERQRLLENMLRSCQENLAFWTETEGKEETGVWDRNCNVLQKGRLAGLNLLQTFEKIIQAKDPDLTGVWQKMKEGLQDKVGEVQVMEFADYFQNLNQLAESADKIIRTVWCSLPVVERPTKQDLLEAEALRYVAV